MDVYKRDFLKSEKSAIYKINEPIHSTLEEKLYATAYLSSVANKIAIKTLNDALHMIELPLSKSKQTKSTEFRGGLLPYQAARSLALNPNALGMKILTNEIKSKNNHPFLREACVYGLAGIHRLQAYEALIKALNDSNNKVRLRALLSLKTTLESEINILNTEKNKIIESISFFFFQNITSNISSDEITLARYLMIKYFNKNTLNFVENILFNNNDIKKQLETISIVTQVKNLNYENLLIKCLIKKNNHPDLYRAIGAILAGTSNNRIKSIAKSVSRKSLAKMKFFSFILPYYAKSLKERYLAALKIV